MTVRLFDQSTIQDPYPLYDYLLREAPIYRDEATGLWFISPFRESEEMLKSQERFSSVGVFFEPTLIGADDPEHAAVRNVIRHAFAGEGLTLWKKILEDLIDPVLDRFVENRKCEFMKEVAWYLPMAAMATFLGIPPEHHADCRRWAKVITETANESTSDEQRIQELGEFSLFFEEHVRRRSENRSVPVFKIFEGSDLREDQMRDICMVLLIAGSETTTNQLGNSMLQALKTPGHFQRLRSQPESIRSFINESLRYDSPVQRVSRRTVTEVEVLGEKIPGDSYVIALLGAANRDPSRFPDPGVFNMDRDDGPHLAFGAGSHYCLGNQLSKWEAEIFWRRFLERLPDPVSPQPADTVKYRDSYELRGPASLDLEFPGARV